MALYLISYDIASYDRNEYPKLWNTLGSIGATKIMYSEWVLIEKVKTDFRNFVNGRQKVGYAL